MTESNRFFTNKDNDVLFGHVMTVVKFKLDIPQSIDCNLVREERITKIEFDDPAYEPVRIQKSGNDFKLFDGKGKSLGSFANDHVVSLQVLFDGLAMNNAGYSDHLLTWLPKEGDVSYFVFNGEKWYSTRHIVSMNGELTNKKHIMSSSVKDDSVHCNLVSLNKKGLNDIMGLPFDYLHTDCKKITFITQKGIDILLSKPRKCGKTRNLMDKIKEWITGSAEEVEVDSPQNMVLDMIMPEFAGKSIRITQDKRVSVIDVIMIICECSRDDAGKNFRRLLNDHPDVRTICPSFKFKGQGQNDTPVTDDKGIYEIIMILPSKKAASIRKRFAELIGRYLRGDQSLHEEIDSNYDFQQSLTDDSPLKLSVENSDPSILEIENMCDEYGIESVLMSTLDGKSGLYLTIVGIHNNKPIINYGYTDVSVGKRMQSHYSRYKNAEDPNFKHVFKPIYFRELTSPKGAETALGNRLTELGLHLGKSYRIGKGKGSINRELCTITQEYTIADLIDITDKVVDNYLSQVVMSDDKDHVYRMRELDIRMMELKLKEMELKLSPELQVTHAKTRQMELQLAIMRESTSVQIVEY